MANKTIVESKPVSKEKQNRENQFFSKDLFKENDDK